MYFSYDEKEDCIKSGDFMSVDDLCSRSVVSEGII